MSASQACQSAPPARLGEFDGVYRLQEMLNRDLTPLGLQESAVGGQLKEQQRYDTYGDRLSLLAVFDPYPQLFCPRWFRHLYPKAIQKSPISVLQPRFLPSSIVSGFPNAHVQNLPRQPKRRIL